MRITKNKEVRRQEIIEVATRLFTQHGYEQTSVSDIVRATGVAQGTFYYHFKSKEDILVAVAKRSLEAVERLLDEIAGDTTCAVPQRIVKTIESLFELYETKRDFILFIHREENERLHHRLIGFMSRTVWAHLLKLTKEGVRNGSLRVQYPEETIAFFLGGIMRIMHAEHVLDDPKRILRFREVAMSALRTGLGME